ncbi:hypothetical protein BHF71_01470 [Vulcanibacillus modesticaldus]|uniref:Putative aromatic acid exporter C-terminal domain-containing protein n=1 Tax=Vulcanibacillus modesticaldus TaxID=337097 RepID=A0A1D2YVW8_9BACI|nr:aromatic acid exporter family protein [Vulcanibacillus modesticaldus]OEF99870.1 hypothetical protein BHF71_01470 [Vulcanibacillus modesticaldus]
MKIPIGSRILKSGIAVTIALFTSQFFGIDSNFAGVVALIGVKQTTKKSIDYGVTLLLGSILSIFIGILVGFNIGTGPLAFGIATIIAIAAIVTLNLTEGLILAVVVMYHVLAAISTTLDTIWIFSIKELIYVLIGIAISVIINAIAPQKYEHQLEENIKYHYKLFSKHLYEIAEAITNPSSSKTPNKNNILNHRIMLKQMLNQAEIGRENCLHSLSKDKYELYIYKLKSLQKLLALLTDISSETDRLSDSYIYSEKVAKMFKILAKIQLNPETTTSSSYKRVFNSIDDLNKYFQDSPLPETRREFEDRSLLYHLFLYVNDYLELLFLLKKTDKINIM